MIEVDNLGIVTHTHFILLHVFKAKFITKIVSEFQKNEVSKKSVFGKTSFWKKVLTLKRIFIKI